MSTRTDTLVPFTTLVRSNKAQEADQAERVAMQVDARLRDQLAVLERVRALYQSDDTASGFGVRSYLAALQPRVRAPGMQGVGIAVAMRRATPAAAEQRLRDNYGQPRSEEHTSELQSLMRISYAVFCLKKKKQTKTT